MRKIPFPVLDDDNKLLGVITAQDIVEVVDVEMGDDYAKLAGMTEEADWKKVSRRVSETSAWLVELLV